MKRQLGDYLKKDVILSSGQHEFGRGHLTVTPLASLLGKIYEAFEDGKSIMMTKCDISKAFYINLHEILLGKLELYGVWGGRLSEHFPCVE